MEQKPTKIALAVRKDKSGCVNGAILVLTREQVLHLIQGDLIGFSPTVQAPLTMAIAYRETDDEALALVNEFLTQVKKI